MKIKKKNRDRFLVPFASMIIIMSMFSIFIRNLLTWEIFMIALVATLIAGTLAYIVLKEIFPKNTLLFFLCHIFTTAFFAVMTATFFAVIEIAVHGF